jgi:hypothetical protein
MLQPQNTGRGGPGSTEDQVGTLLLGGKPRTDSVPAKVDRTVASSRTSPRIHIVRLPHYVDAPVTNVTALRPKAS